MNFTINEISDIPSFHTLSSSKGWHCVALAELPVAVDVDPALVSAGRPIHPILQRGPGYRPCAIFLGPEIVTIEISLKFHFLWNYLGLNFP